MVAGTENDRTRRLCAVLGHELRNPLASAMTSVQLASALMDASDPRADYLRQATVDLDRISSLLSAYLEFGRVGRGSRRLLDLTEVVRAVVSRKCHTRATLATETCAVRGDADLIGRALENMIENALDAGASRVEVSLDTRDGAAVIEVSDNGPGIPAKLRDRVFDPFVSGRNSSGLGLAVARDVIESHGGRITLADRGRRGGALFQIILPLEPARAETQATA